jgi:hypothetical protein
MMSVAFAAIVLAGTGAGAGALQDGLPTALPK